jgi:hypothetical protein
MYTMLLVPLGAWAAFALALGAAASWVRPGAISPGVMLEALVTARCRPSCRRCSSPGPALFRARFLSALVLVAVQLARLQSALINFTAAGRPGQG